MSYQIFLTMKYVNRNYLINIFEIRSGWNRDVGGQTIHPTENLSKSKWHMETKKNHSIGETDCK